ncbi:Bug family tripartite tricarboxylate transporter substrate binding protein [Pseudorhodoferax sp.]|uniref:Bug family tripartite tricarboxylate transporter substrate binding protein n=1 Tax=Pseudorhodoferax sp. TaxID=1993553 RepID=UPI002DD62F5E|nr:tripartite tricarboxylate transporter substrate binding protein [Pseudorhodoferax sp.]
MNKRHALRLLPALVLGLAGPLAGAQTFPDRPITLVVPFAPGASADGIARIVGRELGAALGQQVVVDNKPGGGGATGLIVVAKSAADGYTIGLGATGAIAVNPHLSDAAPLNPETQLDPVGKLADIPLVVVTGAKSGLNTLQAVIDKARQTEVTCGNSGNYTSQHLAAELLASMARVKLTSIPYRGSAPAVTDLLGGQTTLAVVDLTSAYPHVKSGSLRALGLTSAARSKVAPEIPTVAEAGVPGYAATGWMGLFMPKGVPAPVAARLSQELGKVLAKPDVQAQILALAAEPAYLDGAQFGAFIAAESKKWSQVIATIPKPAK